MLTFLSKLKMATVKLSFGQNNFVLWSNSIGKKFKKTLWKSKIGGSFVLVCLTTTARKHVCLGTPPEKKVSKVKEITTHIEELFADVAISFKEKILLAEIYHSPQHQNCGKLVAAQLRSGGLQYWERQKIITTKPVLRVLFTSKDCSPRERFTSQGYFNPPLRGEAPPLPPPPHAGDVTPSPPHPKESFHSLLPPHPCPYLPYTNRDLHFLGD